MEEADKSPSCLLGKPFKHATRKQVQSTKGPSQATVTLPRLQPYTPGSSVSMDGSALMSTERLRLELFL